MHRARASLPASALLSILRAWRAAGWPSARASALSTAFCTAEYLGRYLGRAQWIHSGKHAPCTCFAVCQGIAYLEDRGAASARACALSTAFCTIEYLGRYLGRAQFIHC